MAKKPQDARPTSEAEKPPSFEEAFAQLQDIVRELESGEQSLDDSLKLYEQGIASLRTCHTLLNQAEQRIRKLVAGAGGKVAEESFDSDVYTGETSEIAVEPGDISRGTTQLMPVVKGIELGNVTVKRPAVPPKRGRSNKDDPLFNDS